MKRLKAAPVWISLQIPKPYTTRKLVKTPFFTHLKNVSSELVYRILKANFWQD